METEFKSICKLLKWKMFKQRGTMVYGVRVASIMYSPHKNKIRIVYKRVGYGSRGVLFRNITQMFRGEINMLSIINLSHYFNNAFYFLEEQSIDSFVQRRDDTP
ncbi:hypothetical protein RF11_13629 [Thelohanellus kitauei]|uniref:Uncharacterized protein n=1 Tax=Thelohanellus kitauei TaxID=669202 RepID=A0A0C2NHR4_THEKT|nr:hypothetical protein RF11_13629 [Thelohanellus kitauei]